MFRRLFRIYGHIYYSHTQEIVDLGLEAHLNTAFKHFYLFIREFNLVESKEMEPLQHVIEKIKAKFQQDGVPDAYSNDDDKESPKSPSRRQSISDRRQSVVVRPLSATKEDEVYIIH